MFARIPKRFPAREASKIRVAPVPSRSLTSRLPNRPSRPLVNANNVTNNPSARPRGLRPQIQSRNLTYVQWLRLGFKKASKDIWRKNPVMLPLAIVSVVVMSGLLVYVIYDEFWVVRPRYSKFPRAVEKPLRRAVYFTEIKLDPQRALEGYKEALRIALQQEGMHPYSKEVLGIKIQAAAMLQKAGLFAQAIQILEQTSKEALAWIEESRRRSALRGKQQSPSPSPLKAKDTIDNKEGEPLILDAETRVREEEAQEERIRSWTLQKVVGMKMSLGLLYEEERKHKKALEAQTAAIELLLTEMKRRESLGLPLSAKDSEVEDGWMDSKSIAFAFENTAESFQERNHPQLAIPLYLKSLELLSEMGDEGICHRALIMNNIAGAMINSIQQDGSLSSAERSRGIDAARQWAQRAFDTATRPRPQAVEEDQCGETSVTAMFNLGHIAELQKQWPEAELRYIEAKKLASDLNWSEGVNQSEEATRRLQKQKAITEKK